MSRGAPWRVGIYARLSVEGEDRKKESIENQIQLGKAYIEGNGHMELIRCYQDLGRSGRSFERKGFQEMLEDGRAGIINCVLVKDLSRLGRNYLETGIYVERIFPLLGIRLIACTDGYDSLDLEGKENAGLKNMVNDLYAQDIARRVLQSKRLKKAGGSYVGGRAPYGFTVIEQEGKRLLRPDENTREIVRELFEAFGKGKSLRELAREMQRRGIRPPGEYEKTGRAYRKDGEEGKAWGTGTIREILKNPVYGDGLGKDGGIVPFALQERCRKRLEERKKYRGDAREGRAEEFTRDVFCGLCGRRMGRHRRRSKDGERHYVRYVCPGMECGGMGISLSVMMRVAGLIFVLELSAASLELEEIKDFYEKNRKDREKRRAQVEKDLWEKKKRLEKNMAFGYMAYCKGEALRGDFLADKKRMEAEGERLEQEIQETKRRFQMAGEREEEREKSLLEVLDGGRTDPGERERLLGCLVRRITLYPGKRMEILWNFRRNVSWEG